MTAPPSGSAAVRTHLVEALHADIVGPFDGDPNSAEVLPCPPSRFYLTGFLAPSGDRDPDNPADDEFDADNPPDPRPPRAPSIPIASPTPVPLAGAPC